MNDTSFSTAQPDVYVVMMMPGSEGFDWFPRNLPLPPPHQKSFPSKVERDGVNVRLHPGRFGRIWWDINRSAKVGWLTMDGMAWLPVPSRCLSRVSWFVLLLVYLGNLAPHCTSPDYVDLD